jgi:hypothetical protein
MKKINSTTKSENKDIKFEIMDNSASKYYISTTQIKAVTSNNRVQNYEDYINDKYLTGAVVNKSNWKKFSGSSVK